jgi:hypothetical protein
MKTVQLLVEIFSPAISEDGAMSNTKYNRRRKIVVCCQNKSSEVEPDYHNSLVYFLFFHKRAKQRGQGNTTRAVNIAVDSQF